MKTAPYAVLAVEDDGVARLFMTTVSSRNPAARIVQVTDGEEALDFLCARGRFDGRDPRNPSVVFIDLELPRIDGLEVLREIRSNPELRTVPVVMLASSTNSVKMERCYFLGANAHVQKPVDARQLVNFARTLGDFWLTMNEAPVGVGRRVLP